MKNEKIYILKSFLFKLYLKNIYINIFIAFFYRIDIYIYFSLFTEKNIQASPLIIIKTKKLKSVEIISFI
jgi:hypothetical protein